ncbi:MAG: Brp/Blh family beta-carotene 15,15'-dioxygenase [Opitutales bacterium]|nr:Brp/Blh family beta-carotene 15,15'-dioxygenase [Opitutales bacterium]
MSAPSSLWLSRFQAIHLRALVIVLAMTVLLSGWVAQIEGLALGILLAIGVAIFGVPHGALDLTLVRGMGVASRRHLAFVTGGYLLLALGVLISWSLAPVTTLAFFLIISVIHFGLGDTEALRGAQRWLEVSARGGLPIAAPLAFHAEVTHDLFLMLTGPATVAAIERLMAWALPLVGFWAVCLFLAVALRLYQSVQHKREHIWAVGELIGLLCVFYLLHPLAAFLIYFCAAHSVRHLADLAAARHPLESGRAARWIGWESLPLSLATVLIALGFALGMSPATSPEATLVRVVFQGLAALTLPHMILTAIWHRLGEPRPGNLFTGTSGL